MNLKALRYAVEVAKTESFTTAAKNLHIAQPALSMAVSRLEDELGIILFNRAGRKVLVTTEGGQFLQQVGHSLVQIDIAKKRLLDSNVQDQGIVRVGYPPMYGISVLPDILAVFNKRYPQVELIAVEGGAAEIRHALEARKIDLAIMEAGRVRPDWESVPIGQDEVVLCVPRRHPYSEKVSISPADLSGLRMVVHDQSYLQRRMLDDYCAVNQIKFDVVLEANFVPMLVRAAENEMGAVTLLRSNVAPGEKLVAIPFEPPQLMRFSIAWRAGEYLPVACQKFIDCVKAQFQELCDV